MIATAGSSSAYGRKKKQHVSMILSEMRSMMEQEERGYLTTDYLSQQQQQQPQQQDSTVSVTVEGDDAAGAAEKRQEVEEKRHEGTAVDEKREGDDPQYHPVDVECRDKMAAWCFDVIDFCRFSRETVSIALSYVDRFLQGAGPDSLVAARDRKTFQLAVMTALYTAVKIHEPAAMNPKFISFLSRGTVTIEQVEDMERKLLFGLRWRVNPPTPLSFCRRFLDLLEAEGIIREPRLRDAVYEMTMLQTEVAAADYSFVTCRPSTIAACAILNALESGATATDGLLQAATKMLGNVLDLRPEDYPSMSIIQNHMYNAAMEGWLPEPTVNAGGKRNNSKTNTGTGGSAPSRRDKMRRQNRTKHTTTTTTGGSSSSPCGIGSGRNDPLCSYAVTP